MMKKDDLSNILIIIVAVICSGGAIAGGANFLNQNNIFQTKISQRQAELIQMQQKVAALPLLKEKSKAGIAEIKNLQQFAPSRQEQAAFILELQRMSQNCGVEIVYCKLDEKAKIFKDLPSYQVFQWAVELNGDYGNIKRFLETIPKLKRFMMVSDLNINSSEPEAKNRKAYQLNTKLVLDLIAPVGQGQVKP